MKILPLKNDNFCDMQVLQAAACPGQFYTQMKILQSKNKDSDDRKTMISPLKKDGFCDRCLTRRTLCLWWHLPLRQRSRCDFVRLLPPFYSILPPFYSIFTPFYSGLTPLVPYFYSVFFVTSRRAPCISRCVTRSTRDCP